MRQDWAGKMGSGLTLRYKHLVIFNGYNITGDEPKHCWGKVQQSNH